MASNTSSETPESVKTKENICHQDFGAVYFGVRFKTKIVWFNVLFFIILHLFGLYAVYLLISGQCKLATFIFSIFLYQLSGMLGTTAGVHRLWTHRSYKAKWPLRFVMMICNCIGFQNTIYEWTRDHRVHHKYSDTDADPHNTKRGFFFSHMGWLMMKKHPEVFKKGKGIDLSDLHEDAFVMFQKKHHKALSILFAYILPSMIPVLAWDENVWTAYFIAGAWKHLVILHATWSVNSVAHFWGNKPYDETIRPTENLLVALVANGEGYHNYHHTFPFDYSTSEYRFGVNMTTLFIDTMAYVGLAYDRKKIKKDSVNSRRVRTGNLRND